MLRGIGARLALVGMMAWAVAFGTGCAAKPDDRLVALEYAGQHGQAIDYLNQARLEREKDANYKKSRNYMLDQVRLGIVCLAEGHALAINPAWRQVYEVLTTQGVNADKTVASMVINQDVLLWKGEPFEQALAYCYIGINQAMQGSWDNMRSASIGSLFPLRDFGKNEKGERATNQDIIAKAAKEGDEVFTPGNPKCGYVARDTNFTLGYLLAAVANQQLSVKTGDANRMNEANDYYARAVGLAPALAPLAAELKAGNYNALFVVDFGHGPQKIGTGPDQAIATFVEKTPSDQNPLRVAVGGVQKVWPAACDVNVMAKDHMWNNLEDMRIAKSVIGSVLVGAGATMMNSDKKDEQRAGVMAVLLGWGLKKTAHADTRYCEIMPQRVYLVPVRVQTPGEPIEFQVDNYPGSHLLVPGPIPPRRGEPAVLRYVRLVSDGIAPPPWALSGRPLYATDYCPECGSTHLPYILGGDDVRTPTQDVLESYQRQGFLKDMTLSQLTELYRGEGIALAPQDTGGVPGMHILEGGRSLLAPLPGTAGFARLFCQRHAPYVPRTAQVRDLMGRTLLQLHAPPTVATVH